MMGHPLLTRPQPLLGWRCSSHGHEVRAHRNSTRQKKAAEDEKKSAVALRACCSDSLCWHCHCPLGAARRRPQSRCSPRHQTKTTRLTSPS